MPRGPRGRRITTFLLITTAVSAPFWVLGALLPVQLWGMPISALMFIAPLVGAAWVHRLGGASTIPQFVARPVRARPLRWWRLALWSTLMPAVVLSTQALHAVEGRRGGSLHVDIVALALSVAVFTVSATAEELGWTRFLAAQLHDVSLMGASLTIGSIWAGLHLIPYIQAGHDAAWIVSQVAFTILFRLVLVVSYRDTGRWWVTVVTHASYNVCWVAIETGGTPFTPPLTFAVLLLVVLAGFAAHQVGVSLAGDKSTSGG